MESVDWAPVRNSRSEVKIFSWALNYDPALVVLAREYRKQDVPDYEWGQANKCVLLRM